MIPINLSICNKKKTTGKEKNMKLERNQSSVKEIIIWFEVQKKIA